VSAVAEKLTLTQQVTQPPAREKVVEDCLKLIDEEVRAKGGFSGVAIKTGYGVVKAVKPRFVREVVDGLLDAWVAKLEPFFDTWQKNKDGKPFSDYLGARRPEVAEELLHVTDDKAKTSKNGTVKKMYERMRPSAKKNVEEAIPKLGRILEKHFV
jgi:hypothetical protein